MTLRDTLARIAFAIAHSPPGRLIVGLTFAHLSFALPVRCIIETPSLIAFYHPRPSYKVHILIVPKRAIAGLQALDEQDDSLLLDVYYMVDDLIEKLDLGGRGAQLIVNGGAYQIVPQLHFHLVCDAVIAETSRS